MEGVRDNRPGWNETVQLAVWRDGQGIVAPAKWTMTQGTAIPSGVSFEVRRNHATRTALERARTQVAALLGARGGQIVFTGSGSEADNLAIRGTVLAAGVDRPHVITQPTEHPAVLQACRALRRWHDAEITYLPVNADGLVDPAALAAAFTDRTVLVSIMAANNETGAPATDRRLRPHHP